MFAPKSPDLPTEETVNRVSITLTVRNSLFLYLYQRTIRMKPKAYRYP